MEVSALEFPRENIYVTIHAGVKTARRKVVSTKHFIKAKVQSQGGRAGRLPTVEPDPRLSWDWILLVFSGLVGAMLGF